MKRRQILQMESVDVEASQKMQILLKEILECLPKDVGERVLEAWRASVGEEACYRRDVREGIEKIVERWGS